jgi:hypothetical protein
MSAEWQSDYPAKPNFQEICVDRGDLCAIDNPDEPIITSAVGDKTDIVKRSEFFSYARGVIAQELARQGQLTIPKGISSEEVEVHDAAYACAKRIENGDCSKFLLNKGEIYSDRPPGLLSYMEARAILDSKAKEEK